MTKKIEDGGPAFPQNEFSAYTTDREGVCVRDWIAATIYIPWDAVRVAIAMSGNKYPTAGEIISYRARLRYLEADAMLAARKAGEA